MSNKYIEQGVSKETLLKKLIRCSDAKKILIKEALAALEATPEPTPEPVVEAAPVVEAVEVVAEEPAPAPKKKRTYRRRKTTKATDTITTKE